MLPGNSFPYLKEFVYGGIDGCITTFAVVAGATGADLNSGIIIILGFANLIADGFSMSVGNYLSTKSELASEKNHAQNSNARSPFQTAVATFISFIIMGFIPLLVYVLNYLNVIKAAYNFAGSCGLTLLALFTIGFLRSYVTKTSRFKSIAETLGLGGIAAVLAYYVGSVLENMLS
jgi:VIT1/CCC1 family predicted Fe2+/Mn2+ transporter